MKENNNICPWQQEADADTLRKMHEDVRQAYAQSEEESVEVPSVDAAWHKFDAKHHVTPRPSLWRRWSVAASIALACFVVVALSWPSLRNIWMPDEPLAETSFAGPAIQDEPTIEEDAQTISYRNVPLSEIVAQLAMRYNATVENHAAEDVRLYVVLDRQWSLAECIDFLNHFEQVSITLTNDSQIEIR